MLEKIKSRFQFLATIAMFFPVILEYLLRVGGQTDKELSSPLLYYSLEIAILIVSYILLENTKELKSKGLYKIINSIIFANLASFAIVLYIFAGSQNIEGIPFFYQLLFGATFPMVLVLPIILLVLFVINLFVPKKVIMLRTWDNVRVAILDQKQ